MRSRVWMSVAHETAAPGDRGPTVEDRGSDPLRRRDPGAPAQAEAAADAAAGPVRRLRGAAR